VLNATGRDAYARNAAQRPRRRLIATSGSPPPPDLEGQHVGELGTFGPRAPQPILILGGPENIAIGTAIISAAPIQQSHRGGGRIAWHDRRMKVSRAARPAAMMSRRPGEQAH
jgi:hypothetical protein